MVTARTSGRARTAATVLRSVLAAGLGIAILWWLVPLVSGATWHAVGDVLSQLSLLGVAALALLWFAGLCAHTWVLTGAMPNLSHRRALTLNLTGSAVANIAPLGGALGVATNLRMTRAWRLRDSAFAAFTLVTNIWDVLAKLTLPLVALVVLLANDGVRLPSLRVACIAATVAIAVVLGTLVVWLTSDRAADALGRGAAKALGRLPGRAGALAVRLPENLHAARVDTRDIVRRSWHQLTLGMTAYVGLQCLLLWGCLHLVGVPVAVQTLLVAFALERLGTLAVVTPGGIGVGEAATLAALVALGSPPAATAAGLLLFRCFTFAIEIPVGGLWLGGWLVAHRHDARPVAA